MRVCIIGPMAPFRGGISRHTTALARELGLRAGIDLSVVSFSRQYPQFLYPGETDKDPNMPALEGVEINFCLDTMNPLSWLTTAKWILSRQPELAVIPVWSFFVAPCLGFVARALRRNGVPVTMIVHNAEDHEAAPWKAMFTRFQLRQASRFLTHNRAIEGELRRLATDQPIGIHPHPVYDDYPEPRGELARIAALELLFFGLIRPYKGLDVALRALAAADLQDVRLAVVGEFWQGEDETVTLIRDLGLSDKVELVSRYVTDQEAAEFFARCDAVIAPYRSATGSGVVALAQHYCRPVIASDVPGLSQAIADGSTGWLFAAGDVSALAQTLKTRVSRSSATAMHPDLRAAQQELSWQGFADAVLDGERGLP